MLPPGQGDVVVVPLFGDQPTNAVRVAVARAGVVVPFEGIRTGLELVLENDSSPRSVQADLGRKARATAIDGFLASVIDQPG